MNCLMETKTTFDFVHLHKKFSEAQTPTEELKAQRTYFALYDSLSKEEQQAFKIQLDSYVKQEFESIKAQHLTIQKM